MAIFLGRGALCSILLWLSFATTLVVSKKNRNQPHHHKGVLTPYEPGPFSVSVSKKEEEQLKQGQSVMKQSLPSGSDTDGGAPPSGGVLCIQDVEAPPEAVWYQILNLNDYPSKVAKLRSSNNYVERYNKKDNTYNIKTKMVLSAFPGYSFESYYDHTYHPTKSSLTWTLDYDKTSDFDDVSGHWHVEGLGQKKSRVFYACDVQMGGPIPTPLLNYIGKQALKQATSWVKKESEANPGLKHEYTPQTTKPDADGEPVGAAAGVAGRFAALPKPKWGFKKQ